MLRTAHTALEVLPQRIGARRSSVRFSSSSAAWTRGFLATRASLPSPPRPGARSLHTTRPLASLFTPPPPGSSSSFSRPAPPALPPHLQREFDELVKRAQTPAAQGVDLTELKDGEEMHPDVVRRPAPEFEGDENPTTGERGGPKREPLVHGDWAYGGKVTDF